MSDFETKASELIEQFINYGNDFKGMGVPPIYVECSSCKRY